MAEPIFLDFDEVKLIQANQIELYGGDPGVRDEQVLLSAIDAPRWAYQYGQSDLVELAAVYFYHLVMNHGFVDGNKRVGTVAAIVFLDLNGYWLEIADEELEKLALEVAGSQLDKEQIGARLRPFVLPTEVEE